MEEELSRKRDKALEPLTRVDRDKFTDDRWRMVLDLFGESTKTNREILNRAMEILNHRDGTFYEDLAFIDTVKNKSLINKDFDFYDEVAGVSACKPNKPMLDMLGEAEPETLIGIHNHPKSYAPSVDDMKAALERKYKFGIVICHNGIIYKYSVSGCFDYVKVEFNLAFLGDMVYNKDEKRIQECIETLREFGVELEVIL